MEIVGIIVSVTFVVSLICVAFSVVVHLISPIIDARKIADTKLGEQRIRDLTAEDLGYSIPFSNVPVPKKKWVTPHIVEEPNRRLEFTGIRAIQL